ncbi:MAG: hypothetical protein OEU36_26070, partial [Gammaproteobacteria bacterium]|nr:hypothetical protein [Gammaproteobacteria bacterium]
MLSKIDRLVRIWYHHWMAVAFEGHTERVARRHVEALVQLGDQWGQLEMAAGLLAGHIEAEQVAAVDLYRKASLRGEDLGRIAQFNLGTCYMVGAGVAKDEASAATWFRMSSEAAHPE